MDQQGLRIAGRAYGVKARSKLRFFIGMVGVGLIIWGAYNMMLASLIDYPIVAPYRQFAFIMDWERGFGYYIGDVLVMAVGMIIVAWS